LRRYDAQPIKRIEASKVYNLLKQAKINTVTKISALTLKKNEPVHQKIAELLPETDYATGDILRVIEGSKIFKVVFDQKNYQKMIEIFQKNNIVDSNQKLGMVELIYPDILQKTPGVFSVISNELAENDIT
jgi:hypothetical protein